MLVDTVRADLALVADVIMPGGVQWAVAAGAAVFLYARNRTPTDLDVLVRSEDLPMVEAALGVATETESTAWGEVTRVQMGGIEIAGRLAVRAGARSYLYYLDSDMAGHIRHLTYHGIEIPVLAPEDLVALKAVLQRGPEQGKHDLEDIDALAASTRIDPVYLRLRLERMRALDRARSVLGKWEWGRRL